MDETRNARVQARYDELMREGKHGHYETMFRVVRGELEQSSTLLADAKRERDAALAEIVGLRNISKANIATMEGTVIRLNSYEKAHGELDLAIRETREVLSSPSPASGVERVIEAAKLVHDKFKRDEDQGFRSRDRQYAIAILGNALASLTEGSAKGGDFAAFKLEPC